MTEQEIQIWRDEALRKAQESLARLNADALQMEQRMRLPLALSQPYPVGADRADPRPSPPSVRALGAIIAHNMQQNTRIREAVAQPEPVNPHAPPPRVTVQDIFDYHAEKDRTAIPIRSVTDPH